MQRHLLKHVTLVTALCGCILLCSSQAATERGVAVSEQGVKGPGSWLYFDLGCEPSPWHGYFSPRRWDASSEPIIRDGVVFLAADTIEETRWLIELPANGFLSFRLRGDRERIAGAKISVDGVDQPLVIQAGELVYTPYLHRGERFYLLLPPGPEEVGWADLHFHTNARGVFILPTDQGMVQRYRPVESTYIERVFFPEGGEWQNWPVFDYDGLHATTDDQMILNKSTDHLLVDFVDSVELVDDQYFMMRHFDIRENCDLGNQLSKSVKWYPLPLIGE